jgi:hypothetical protein
MACGAQAFYVFIPSLCGAVDTCASVSRVAQCNLMRLDEKETGRPQSGRPAKKYIGGSQLSLSI